MVYNGNMIKQSDLDDIVRFTNQEVEADLPKVIEAIKLRLAILPFRKSIRSFDLDTF